MGKANSESIKVFSRATQTQAGNLSGLKAPGQKKFEDVFVESRVGSVNRGSSFVTSKSRSTIDQQGNIVSTGVRSDLAIEGNGMLVVSETANGERVFTRRGDFRQDELGFWKNGANQLLMAWELDNDGNVPQNASLLTSLKPVNFANTKGEPKATTAISISMNLDANQKEIRGAGPLFKMQRTGLNATTALSDSKDLLIPEITASGGLQLGDRFDIQSIPPSIERSLVFGGMTVGRAPTAASTVAGANNTTDEFRNLVAGSTLKISVEGTAGASQTYTFVYKAGNPSTKDKEFNNVVTLAAAINKVSALNSTVDRNGNIHIGTTDPNASMTFADGNGGTIARDLGLYDIAKPANNVKRFNSLATLQAAVNEKKISEKLKAQIVDGNIDITSLSATDNFEMKTTSKGTHRIRHATLGGGTGVEAIKKAGTVAITAPNNGLRVGDYVRLKDTGVAKLPDGVYYVSAANSQEFQVSILVNDPAANAAAGGAIGGLADGYPVPAASAVGSHDIAPLLNIIDHKGEVNSPTWTKIAGREGFKKADSTITGTNGTSVVIDIGAGNAGAGINQINVNDVVYISGAGQYAEGGNIRNIPDGYYHVNAVNGGNTIEILYKDNGGAGAAPAGTTSNLSVTKIGHKDAAAAFGANLISTEVFSVDNAVSTNSVRVHIPNHNYSVDDLISFNGLPPNYAIDTATIKDDFKYKIVATGDNYVDIEALDANGDAVVIAAPVRGAYEDHGNALYNNASDVGNDFRINYFSRTLEFFNSSPTTAVADNRTLTETFVKTYDKDNVEKSLSSGNFDTSRVFTQTVEGFDSLGGKYDLLLRFAKLRDGEWAVEVSGIEQDDGTFNVQPIGGQRADGFIQGGTLTFDKDGNFLGADGVNQEITFTTGNGSDQVNLKLDWENQLGTIKNGTVTQFRQNNNFEFVQQNGQAAGILTNISVTDDGIIVGTYDSGETRDLYKIPVATFANINGLVPGIGGTYRTSRESGNLLLKTAGSNGAGKTVGGALETSNTDTTTELLEAKDISLGIQANARVVGVQIQDQKTILAETQ